MPNSGSAGVNIAPMKVAATAPNKQFMSEGRMTH